MFLRNAGHLPTTAHGVSKFYCATSYLKSSGICSMYALLLRNQAVHNSVDKSQYCTTILATSIQLTYSRPNYLKSILIFSCHLCLGLPIGRRALDFRPKYTYISFNPRVPHVPPIHLHLSTVTILRSWEPLGLPIGRRALAFPPKYTYISFNPRVPHIPPILLHLSTVTILRSWETCTTTTQQRLPHTDWGQSQADSALYEPPVLIDRPSTRNWTIPWQPRGQQQEPTAQCFRTPHVSVYKAHIRKSRCAISGSHGDEYEDARLLRCATQTSRPSDVATSTS
jgi:hypothetical protein